MNHSLNVTMANQLLRSDDVIVTLQWPREPGAVYHVNILPETPHTELTFMRHNMFTLNLTISYDIQYNVSIESSLCGVTTIRIFNYGKYNTYLAWLSEFTSYR
jgi:phage-related protein